ncbi:hypothetical protein [Nitrosopumilus sp.]|uniref:hypothetical protein n=1 Tax=Nitrosopumilus sp. TaxID=2024843 RepID=UPI00292FDDEC|nr:hypothetical protein [Nitrosopumilus sp.]
MSNTLTQNNPYISRFKDMLKPLQSKLSKLETKLDSIDDNHPDKQQSRLNVLEEISKTKQEIQITQKNLECSKTMTVVRSDKVPSDIQDHNVWNDCWYDEERKAFVTFNSRFEEASNSRTRDIQVQYDKEMNNNNSGIIIPEDKIKFRFGYPVIISKNQDDKLVWHILPTMTDYMLTDEIVVGRLRPTSDDNSIIYETESEQWITIGTRGLKLCEKENKISDRLEIYPPVPIEELKLLYNRQRS